MCKEVEIELPEGVTLEQVLKLAETAKYTPIPFHERPAPVSVESLCYLPGKRDYLIKTATHTYFETYNSNAPTEELRIVLRARHPNYDEASIILVEECNCPGCQERKKKEIKL